MSLEIRRLLTVVEDARLAAGRADGTALRKVAAMAVITNPFAGAGYVEDLGVLIEGSDEIGSLLGSTAAAALGAPVISYGKGGLAGTAGEQEQANACLTSVFGEAFRVAVGGGKAWISSVTKRAAPGATIDVPLAYKDAIWVRSHYDAIAVRVPDSPAPDELVIIAAVANRGRLNARLGGMTVEEADA